jgi:biopolymer transport protein ExbB
MSFMEFIRDNLGHVLPILIAGAIAIAITLERSKALFFSYPIPRFNEFYKRLGGLISVGKIQEAIQQCDEYGEKPGVKIIKTALQRSHMPESVIEDGLQIAVAEASQVILKRTGYLATIANVATLLGLFGTIVGLIHSFEAVAHADPQQKSALLSAGIATAMNATMLGLGVAIPCMVVYAFLVNKSNRLIAEMETTATKILDTLKQRFYSNEEFESHSASVPLPEGKAGHGAERRAS